MGAAVSRPQLQVMRRSRFHQKAVWNALALRITAVSRPRLQVMRCSRSRLPAVARRRRVRKQTGVQDARGQYRRVLTNAATYNRT